MEKECLRKILPQKVSSVTACVPERMEVKRKAVLAKNVAFSAPKDANSLRPAKNCQNQEGFFLSFSLTSYFSFFRCIPNNSTQMNDHSKVFYAISLNRTEKPKRKFVTRFSSLAISIDSKCAAKSESLFQNLLPFKNLHVLWIRLRSQTRLLAPFRIDRLSLSTSRGTRDRPAGLLRHRFRDFIACHNVDFKILRL